MEKDAIGQPEELLRNIRRKGMVAVEPVYVEHRDTFVRYAARFGLSQAACLDVYQDAIIAFYENVQAGKLTKLTSSVKTYLFSVGKYLILNRLKAEQKTIPSSVLEFGAVEADVYAFEEIVLTDRQQQLRRALEELGGQCKELITLFYYHRYSIKSIQQEMNYSNENTVKAAKSRCMKKLKELVANKN